MKRLVLLAVILLLAAACTGEQRDVVQTLVAQAPAPLPGEAAAMATPAPGSPATPTPRFSAITLPTPVPTVSGPLGTLTAIAPLVASPVLDDTPYVIENRGRPHFVEFHAWW